MVVQIVKKNKILLLGVSHIRSNTKTVLDELKKLKIDSNTLVFIEPKKNVLLGLEKCDKKSIEYFFSHIVGYAVSKRTNIVPLNPRYLPSHNTPLLYHKYAKQFAEEEYMAEVIETKEHNCEKVVIIGDIHAPRIERLLKQKGCRVKYRKLAPITPDDLIAKSWRAALEGREQEFIGISWLKLINEEVRNILNLPPKVNVQEACWDDENMYNVYLALVKDLIKKHNARKFRYFVNKEIMTLAQESKENGKALLDRYKTAEDHPVLSFPYEMIHSDFMNAS